MGIDRDERELKGGGRERGGEGEGEFEMLCAVLGGLMQGGLTDIK